MTAEIPSRGKADVDADQTNANADQNLSSRDQRGSDKDQGYASLDQRVSDMEQASADRRHRAIEEPTADDERDYKDAKRHREGATSMRQENAFNRGVTRRDRRSTSSARERGLADRDQARQEPDF